MAEKNKRKKTVDEIFKEIKEDFKRSNGKKEEETPPEEEEGSEEEIEEGPHEEEVKEEAPAEEEEPEEGKTSEEEVKEEVLAEAKEEEPPEVKEEESDEEGASAEPAKSPEEAGREESHAGIVLKEGEIEIPSDSKIHLVKRDGRLAVVVGKGGEGEIEIDGEKIDLSEFKKGESISIGEEEKSEVDEILKSMEREAMDKPSWREEAEGDDLIGEVREDINLLDLRKEFKAEEEEEEEEFEEEYEEEVSLIDRLRGMVKKTTLESRDEKLRRLAIDNLEKTRGIHDERKATVGVACVLKEFLEIKFEIARELTYIELVEKLREQEMDNKLRSSLIKFFKKTSIMIYANIAGVANYNQAYNLAKKTIDKLS